ncbi:Hypothetical predicted protein [Octopus vulgaris]|uniref:Uncharacterized protein n=1 Tax=Octopus vulgaris TaxID=6645 RepID=A0AA36F887_OCTVU|nr:Hypothetical predicted protein [Octopus vulgaris]
MWCGEGRLVCMGDCWPSTNNLAWTCAWEGNFLGALSWSFMTEGSLLFETITQKQFQCIYLVLKVSSSFSVQERKLNRYGDGYGYWVKDCQAVQVEGNCRKT